MTTVQTNARTKTPDSFCADFEATTIEDDCRVWGWGLAYIDYPDEVEIDHTIDEFMERISFQPAVCYFHNLKYDGGFILDWLFRNGYEHIDDDGRDVPEGGFRTLISAMGRFYSLKVRFKGDAIAAGNVVEFRDSWNKIPMGVSRVAKAFNQPESKGDIDYHAERPVGHRITAEERDYIRRDVSIMANAMSEVISNGMTKLTVASDAMKEYKKLTGKRFDRLFPKLSEEMDLLIRRAYRGGFTYVDERFRGKKLGSGLVLDVNSLYPSVMKNNLIPYGEPKRMEGEVITDERYPLSILTITFTAKLKKDHIPCIQIKGSNMFAPTEYLRNIDEPTTLTMTNVDFELYNDHYDLDILDYAGGWLFRAQTGMFDAYIDKWAKVKETSKGGKREIAKLHLNSLYGKFATNPLVASKIPVFEDDMVKLKRGADNTRPPVYTAAGVFITSHARNLTIRAAQDNYDVFAYADTDSLHLLVDEVPEGLDVHPTRMGAWKLEYYFKNAFYVRPKFYFEHLSFDAKMEPVSAEHNEDCESDCEIRHDHVNRIAGYPERESAKLTFNDLIHDRILPGKLVPKRVPGGIVLKDVGFKIKL